MALERIPDEFRNRIASGVCGYELFIQLMQEGATTREIYVRQDGSAIGEVLVTRDLCGL
jgi:hypothetical protein